MVKRGTRTAIKAREVTPSKEGRKESEAPKQTNRQMGIGLYMRLSKELNRKNKTNENNLITQTISQTKDKKILELTSTGAQVFDYCTEEDWENPRTKEEEKGIPKDKKKNTTVKGIKKEAAKDISTLQENNKEDIEEESEKQGTPVNNGQEKQTQKFKTSILHQYILHID